MADEQQQETQPARQRLQVFDTLDGGMPTTIIKLDGRDKRRAVILNRVAASISDVKSRSDEVDELRHAAKRGWIAPAPIGGSVDSAANPDEN